MWKKLNAEQAILINMVTIDGKKLAQKILDELKEEIAKKGKRLRLAVILVGKNPVIEKFVEQKKKTGASIDIDVRLFQFKESITTNELRKRISRIVHEKKNTGVIIQLPLPSNINSQYILNSIPPEKDVDMLSAKSIGNFATGKTQILPPVTGSVKAIFDEYKIDYRDKNIVIIGAGKLVGRPVALWLINENATLSVLKSNTPDISEFTKRADIIISGVGKPKLITSNMIKEGAVIIDAGTSESEGKISGDVDFDSVSQKASFITPVPGGIGPMTVATLFKNLITLSKNE